MVLVVPDTYNTGNYGVIPYIIGFNYIHGKR